MFLKFIFLVFLMGSSGILANGELVPVTTVQDFNLDQYLGKWHQIAAIPMWFQRNCAQNTTAVYSKTDGDLIKVENSCEKEDGQKSEAAGRARVNPNLNSSSKLQVTFVSVLGKWIWAFGGNYWVMDIGKRGDVYEYSVVGDPTREYLWILARKPQLTFDELKLIRDKIKDQFYDLSKIVVTQSGELNGKKLSALDAEFSQP